MSDFASIADDEILCASAIRHTDCCTSFLHPLHSRDAIEIKARWGRARRLYGRHVTNYVIERPSSALVCFAMSRDCRVGNSDAHLLSRVCGFESHPLHCPHTTRAHLLLSPSSMTFMVHDETIAICCALQSQRYRNHVRQRLFVWRIQQSY